MVERAKAELAACPVVGTAPSPWLRMREHLAGL
jgi:hypothetical protein